jgi:hypothetical protein
LSWNPQLPTYVILNTLHNSLHWNNQGDFRHNNISDWFEAFDMLDGKLDISNILALVEVSRLCLLILVALTQEINGYFETYSYIVGLFLICSHNSILVERKRPWRLRVWEPWRGLNWSIGDIIIGHKNNHVDRIIFGRTEVTIGRTEKNLVWLKQNFGGRFRNLSTEKNVCLTIIFVCRTMMVLCTTV